MYNNVVSNDSYRNQAKNRLKQKVYWLKNMLKKTVKAGKSLGVGAAVPVSQIFSIFYNRIEYSIDFGL